MSRKPLFLIVLGALVAAFLFAGCGKDSASGVPSFEIDPTLEPAVPSITFIDETGERPVASIADDKGHKVDFIEDEVIVALQDPSELADILSRLNATLLKEIDPVASGAPAEAPTFYLLRVDPAAAEPAELVDLILSSEGENGASHRVSSQRALNLLTAIARESETMGTELGANFLTTYDGLSERTTMEAPADIGGPGDYSPDAFAWPYMNRGSNQDIGAAEAARLVRDAGRVPTGGDRIDFLIIDGGFSSTADYPTPLLPIGSRLDVRNPTQCSGGSDCPWHGTAVASAALSVFDDGVGAAGPASEVVRPIFVQAPNPNFWDYIEYIFVTLPTAFGRFPEIINISASADIPAGLCLVGVCAAVDIIAATVRTGGMLVFASAGNDGSNVDDEDCFIFCWESNYRAPCEAPGVICVGGLVHNFNAKDPDSAWGSEQRDSADSVDIYAPYSTWVHDNPDSGTTNAEFIEGTSFSSPFTAAIAALIKAANPSLGPAGIWETMRETAHTSGDRRMHRWVNAYEAVRRALGNNAPPFVQINQPTEGASFPGASTSVPLSCELDDDGGTSGLSVSWSSDRDGTIGAASASTSTTMLSLGPHVIMCTASDGTFEVSDAVSITITNQPPTISIQQPTDGASFFESQTISLLATAGDPNGNLDSVSWTISRTGFSIMRFGANTSIVGGTLAVGSYNVVATATDTEGSSASDSVTIMVVSDPVDPPPSISNLTLTPPPDGPGADGIPFYNSDVGCDSGGNQCAVVSFNATVTDNNPASLTYTWQLINVTDGGTVTTLSGGAPPPRGVTLAADGPNSVVYVVRLIVNDGTSSVMADWPQVRISPFI